MCSVVHAVYSEELNVQSSINVVYAILRVELYVSLRCSV